MLLKKETARISRVRLLVICGRIKSKIILSKELCLINTSQLIMANRTSKKSKKPVVSLFQGSSQVFIPGASLSFSDGIIVNTEGKDSLNF